MGCSKIIPTTCIKKRYINDLRGRTFAIDLAYQLYRIMIGIKNKKKITKEEPNSASESSLDSESNDESESSDEMIEELGSAGSHKPHSYFDKQKLDIMGINTDTGLIKYEDNRAHLIATCSLVETMCEKHLYGVYVFEGKAPDIKRKKLDERKKRRASANDDCEKIDDKTSDEFIKQHKKTVGLKDKHFADISKLLDAMGLAYVTAPGEADSQCVALSTRPDIEGIIGEDSDIIVFGGTKLVKGYTRKSHTVNEVSLSDVLNTYKEKANEILLANSREPITEFTHENLVDYSIIKGTDYNPALYVRDHTVQMVFELFVLNNFSVGQLIRSIRAKGIKIADSYMGRYEKIKNYFLNAPVLDPKTLTLNIKKPNQTQMTQILCYNNCFSSEFVNNLYTRLDSMYMLANKLFRQSDSFGSFKSYQVKYHRSRISRELEVKTDEQKFQSVKLNKSSGKSKYTNPEKSKEDFKSDSPNMFSILDF